MAATFQEKYLVEETSANIRAWSQSYGLFAETTYHPDQFSGDVGEVLHLAQKDRGSMWQKVRAAQNVICKVRMDARGMPEQFCKPSSSNRSIRTAASSSRRFSLQRKYSSRLSLEDAQVPKWIVNPSGDTKLHWDLWVSMCVMYLTMSMPYALGYEAEASWNRARARYLIDWLVDCVFLIDMAVAFRTAYISDEGVLITDVHKVAMNYMFKDSFLIDFLSVCSRCSIFISSGESSSVLKNARLLRMVRLAKLVKLTRILKVKHKSNRAPVDEQMTPASFGSPSSNGHNERGGCQHVATRTWHTDVKDFVQILMPPTKHLLFQSQTRTRLPDASATPDKSRGRATLGNALSFATHPAVASASWMLVILLVIAHLLACAWHGLAVIKRESSLHANNHHGAVEQGEATDVARHWVNSNGLRSSTTQKKYVVALYWAFQTMTTVGYGDVSISTNSEKIFAIFVMIIGGICFGYIIGNVTSMLENLNMVAALRDQKMDGVKECVFDRHYPPVMAVKIKRHFRYMYAKLGVFFNEADIHDELPTALRADVLREQRRHLIATSALLSHDCVSGCFVAAIIASMVPCKLDSGEFLFFQSEIATHTYLVEAGAVKLLATSDDDDVNTNDTKTIPASVMGLTESPVEGDSGFVKTGAKAKDGVTCGVYAAGRVIGVEGVLLTYRHAYSAYCYTKVHLYTISKEDLIGAVEEYAPGVRLWLEQEATAMVSLVQSRKVKLNMGRGPALPRRAATEATTADTLQSLTVKERDKNVSLSGHERQDMNQASIIREHLMKVSRRVKVVLHNGRRHGFPEDRMATTNQIEESADGPATPAELWAKYGLFHPELEAKVVWDVFVSALIVFSVMGNTYIFAFGLPAKRICGAGALEDLWLILFIFIDMSFLVDMFATFNTAVLYESTVPVATSSSRCSFQSAEASVLAAMTAGSPYSSHTIAIHSGHDRELCATFESAQAGVRCPSRSWLSTTVVTSRRQIAVIYASSGWLAVDLLSSVPIDKVAGCGEESSGRSGLFSLFKMLRALRLVRLAKMRQKSKKLTVFSENLEDVAGVNPAWFKLIRPLFVMFVIAHVLTCLFFYAGRKREEPKAWLDAISDDAIAPRRRTIRRDDRSTQYLTAIYWSFATMTTVGYGDYSPSFDNAPGLAVGIVSNVLGTMIFAYVIGILVSLVTNLNPSRRLHRAEKSYLHHYLSELSQAPDHLLTKVFRAKTHILELNGVLDDVEVLAKLPPYLRANCLLFIYRDVLPYAPFLGVLEREHVNCLTLLLPRLKPTSYLLGQLVNSPHINARELNFVHVGFCALLTKQHRGTGAGTGTSPRAMHGVDTTPGAETYGPQSIFGQATILVPADQPFKLRCRVVCGSAFCHAFLLSKDSLDELRLHYEPLVADIEDRLYDGAIINRWIKLG
eukprot:CAMPEP_0118901470 /NCGR_PEP_ID=MMETSP1166-20130328/7156_1 /TAXON_ID=1104430 /ORGANISM="Chrysoreinhardia sp, Strain CCMP3193" /LENGTH=1406 /DNA_ID=CAMNT_0006840645 /DNA_START=136 /DNA_END=4356 /DNA_ORIENTATION=+